MQLQSNTMAKRQKVYYPKGQIQTGLYTSGGEWMSEDGIEYIGDYHRYTTGEVFTRAKYIKNVSQKLVPYLDLSDDNILTNFEYDNLPKGKVKDFVFAEYSKPGPKDSDYVSGYFIRYFAKRHFNDIITEVTKSTFGKLQEEHYVKLELYWKITGDTFESNQKQVLDGNQTIDGLVGYITDYTEYRQNLTLF